MTIELVRENLALDYKRKILQFQGRAGQVTGYRKNRRAGQVKAKNCRAEQGQVDEISTGQGRARLTKFLQGRAGPG